MQVYRFDAAKVKGWQSNRPSTVERHMNSLPGSFARLSHWIRSRKTENREPKIYFGHVKENNGLSEAQKCLLLCYSGPSNGSIVFMTVPYG